MIQRRSGFTFIELMIIMAIVGILIGALYPKMRSYYAGARDVTRVSDIKILSNTFQGYFRNTSTYPNNSNKDGVMSFCVTDIYSWSDALPQFKDKQYSGLAAISPLKQDPILTHPAIISTPGNCALDGSYFYARLDKESSYAVVAARMERQTTGANYSNVTRLWNPAYISEMVQAKPLDKDADDANKLFILVTN